MVATASGPVDVTTIGEGAPLLVMHCSAAGGCEAIAAFLSG